jgi:hypothetical protein
MLLTRMEQTKYGIIHEDDDDDDDVYLFSFQIPNVLSRKTAAV